MDLGLKGRSALITGGSKGIGLAAAVSLASEGCHVHLKARTASGSRSICSFYSSQVRREVTVHAADLSNGDAARALVDAHANVEILVNNAGAIPAGSIADIDETRWREAWDLKVFGYQNTCRAMLGHMREKGRGVIVNVIGAAGEAQPWVHRRFGWQRFDYGTHSGPRRNEP